MTAPNSEHLDADEIPAGRIEVLAQWLHDRNVGICEMDDDIVYNDLKSMRSLAEALLQHGPDGIRITERPSLAELAEGELKTGIRVTATDLGTGEIDTRVIVDDVCVVVAGACYVAHVADYPKSGTQIYTIKGRHGRSGGKR